MLKYSQFLQILTQIEKLHYYLRLCGNLLKLFISKNDKLVYVL